jgi:hypothetical protein
VLASPIIAPENLLPAITRLVRDPTLPTSSLMPPVNWFASRSTISALGSAQSPSGASSESWFLLTPGPCRSSSLLEFLPRTCSPAGWFLAYTYPAAWLYKQFFLGNNLVLVLHKFGSGPTLLVPLGFVSLVSSILIPSDRGGWTVSINANHCKTCIFLNV